MAEYPNFVGGTYTGQSIAVDGERTVNLYPEAVNADGGHGKAPIVLYRTPGLKLLQTLPGGNTHRGMFTVNGRSFCVVGTNFYEILTDFTTGLPTQFQLRGTLANDGHSVQFATNGLQIFVLSFGDAYLFTLHLSVWQIISGTGGLPNSLVSVTAIDGYFIVQALATNEFFISGLLDGTSWSGLDFGSSEQPENSVAVAANHLYLWIFGQTQTVIFVDTGAASFPFQRVPGSQIQQGCAAVNTIRNVDNTLLWLGMDDKGTAVCYRANGFLPERISNHAIEYQWQRYLKVSDATAYAYQESGHLFYVLSFPSATATTGATWVYDVSTKMWHERGIWNNGQYGAALERYHTYNFGMHLVGDYTNANLYQLTPDAADFNGTPIRWMRAAPHISDEESWIFYNQFQLDMQVGVAPGGGLPGSNPLVTLQYSNDGGFTWSNEMSIPMGPLGAYMTRVIWRRLGRSRNRVFRVFGSDPIPTVALINAYLKTARQAA